MSKYPKIDTHSHFVPPEYRQALLDSGIPNPDGMPAIPPWSEESHLEMMQKVNITKCFLSITSPGVHLRPDDDKYGTKVAQQCNNYASDLKKRKPDQFGFFASIPLPDVQGCLQEIPRAFDDLKADGVVVMTNHHGTYIGNKAFDPVFDELNRRKAVVFIHPSTPCLASGTAAIPLPDYPRPMFEFFFDTARAVINLFLSGTVSRCPNITFIASHLGGAFPALINRFSNVGPLLNLPGLDPALSPTWVKERLNKQFYFDSAGWAFPEQIHGLLQYVTVERILYGSDFPFTPLKPVCDLSADHDRYLSQVFPRKEDQDALCNGNAMKLLGEKSIDFSSRL